MDEGWLAFDPKPSKPQFELPAGAVDAHCHVFGPADRFPYAAARKYTPSDASKESLWAVRDHLGFARNVIVQASCHGSDNAALVDALENSGGRARGVAVVAPDVSDRELDSLHSAGVRAVRFNFLKRLAEAMPRDAIAALAARVKERGWHVVIYFESENLPQWYDFFAALPCVVVVDHMGRPDVTLDPGGPEFGLFLRLLREHENFWCKVTCPERLSKSGPPQYADVIPFATTLVERFPQRVLWGTDWPHPNMKSHMPDDGKLVDFIPKIARTRDLQRQLLVDNPRRLYWPQSAG